MTTKAGRYDEGLFSTHGKSGNVKAMNADTVSVEVFESDGTTNATLYDDRDKTPYSGTGSVVTPDAAGNLEFFADPGTYVLKVSDDGTELRSDTVVVAPDPEEVADGIVPSGGSAGDLLVINSGGDGYGVVDSATYQPVRGASSLGVTGDGTTDDSAALTAAATTLQDSDEILFIPAGMTVNVDSTVDLRRVRRVVCLGTLQSNVTGGPGFIFGDRSSHAEPIDIYIREITHTGTPSRSQPTVRFAGIKNGKVEVAYGDWVQFYADGNTAEIASSAYGRATFGRIETLEVFGENSGWINEFTVEDIHVTSSIIFDGDYQHNGWVFERVKAEGAGVNFDLSVGHSNEFQHVRAESGTTVAFASGTHNNSIASNWRSIGRARLPEIVVTSDDGDNNRVFYDVPTSTAPAPGTASGFGFLGVPGVAFTSALTTATFLGGSIYYVPFVVTETIELDSVQLEVTTAASAGSGARVGIYNADSVWQPGWLAVEFTEVTIDSTGVKNLTSLAQVLGPGRYLAAVQAENSVGLRCALGGTELVGGIAGFGSGSQFRSTMRVASSYAALPSSGTAWSSASTSSTPGIEYPVLFGWGPGNRTS